MEPDLCLLLYCACSIEPGRNPASFGENHVYLTKHDPPLTRYTASDYDNPRNMRRVFGAL
eukprot:2737200-Rhodomonas_salina.3